MTLSSNVFYQDEEIKYRTLKAYSYYVGGTPTFALHYFLIGTTATVSLLTQNNFSWSSKILISHTWVDLPKCNGRAVAVTKPDDTLLRWLALISRPTQ